MDSMYSIIFGILEDDSDVEQILPHFGGRIHRKDWSVEEKGWTSKPKLNLTPLTERLDKIK